MSLSRATAVTIPLSLVDSATRPARKAGAVFVAGVSSNLMTVASLTSGLISLGQVLAGTGISGNPSVAGYGTGAGGAGTYILSSSQTVTAGTTLTATVPITTRISKDGGAFAATTNSAAEIATNTGRYALALTAAEMAAAVVHIIATAAGADELDLFFQTLGLADGVVTGTPSATTIPASGQPETATDHWKNAFMRMTTGTLAGQVRQITGYTTGSFTVTAFTGAPAAGDRYVIVNA